MTPGDDYLGPEARARIEIDRQLVASGWVVQDARAIDLGAAQGVAVREVKLGAGHGFADYVLFVERRAVGIIEAKKAGTPLIGVEWQSAKYTPGLPAHVSALTRPLPFAYEATGVETRFTNGFDPEASSRRVFTFHRPETLHEWCRAWIADAHRPTLRARLRQMPAIPADGLWPAQLEAVGNVEASLAHGRPRALIQMATGSGKTFTAANIAYRLLKHGGARRVLFLVDRANLGVQTLREFQSFVTPDDGRKFTELHNIELLRTSNPPLDSTRVAISTIQRLFSVLTQDDLPEELDEVPTIDIEPTEPVEVTYNPALPPEAFDVIIVDECHRSIYGVWRQVLEYFDAFLIGLTATPGKQTFGFFNRNLVMEYDHAAAVADHVNVDFDVFRISTMITEQGAAIDAGQVTEFRDRETRERRLEKLDEDIAYDAAALDRTVVAKDQIRTIVQTFRERLPEMFPGRTHVPKTLIFAKDDSHAEDIVEAVREEFGKGREFAAKITYRSAANAGRKPEDLLNDFRNELFPRIAVTVDMIATGTDVKPIECVFFMRIVKSRAYFEQMKGRGVRVLSATDLRLVTPDAVVKDRFVLVDAVGVTESELIDVVPPLERQPTVSFERLLTRLAYGDRDPDLLSSVASRLARLDLRLTKEDRAELEALARVPITTLVHQLLDAVDPDTQVAVARRRTGVDDPPADAVSAAAGDLAELATRPFDDAELRQRLVDVRRSYDQVIDETSEDVVTRADFSVDATDRARVTIESFRAFLDEHHDQITALQVLYSRPWSQRLTFTEIKELAAAIGRTPQHWTPESLWQAYETLDRSRVRGSAGTVLTNIVSLVRYALEVDDNLVPFPDLVADRFSGWLAAQSQAGRVFTPEQMAWLERIRDHLAASLTIGPDDFADVPFVQHGGLGRAYEVFGGELEPLLDELTDALVAA